MFKSFFSNRLFIGAFVFFVLCVAGSLLYLQHVKRQSARELAETEERIKTLTEKQNPQPPAEAPVVETPEPPQQDGHFHADGTWHAGPHEAHVEPPSEVSEPEPPPAYIYDPDAKERPDGWDPALVFDTGDKKIDLNYRPLTEEEQAEYERLKATLVPPEDYGVTEAGLIITAIVNIKEKNADAFMKSLWAQQDAGLITPEEGRKRLADYYNIFAH